MKNVLDHAEIITLVTTREARHTGLPMSRSQVADLARRYQCDFVDMSEFILGVEDSIFGR